MFLQLILPLFLCFLPLIIIIIIFSKFQIKINHLLIAILIGLAAVFPISLLQYLLEDLNIFKNSLPSTMFYYFMNSLILYGFLEESLKTTSILLIPHKDYTILQQFMLAVILGLSLASFENVVYFLNFFRKASERGASLLYIKLFKRIFLTDILHMSCAGLGSLFIYTAREKSQKPRWGILILAIILHGAYDFFAGFTNNFNLFSIPVVLLAVIECRIKYTSITSPSD